MRLQASSLPVAFSFQMGSLEGMEALFMLSYDFCRFILIFALQMQVFSAGDKAIKWVLLCRAVVI